MQKRTLKSSFSPIYLALFVVLVILASSCKPQLPVVPNGCGIDLQKFMGKDATANTNVNIWAIKVPLPSVKVGNGVYTELNPCEVHFNGYIDYFGIKDSFNVLMKITDAKTLDIQLNGITGQNVTYQTKGDTIIVNALFDGKKQEILMYPHGRETWLDLHGAENVYIHLAPGRK